MELTVTVTQKGKIFEGKAPEIVNEALTSAMYEAVTLLEREVKKRTPIGVYGSQGGLLSTIHGDVKGIIATQSKYGEVIEKGRTAGKTWPPEGALIRWMEVKLGMDDTTAKRMEFVIRRKIGMKGFPGVHMFENALNENWQRLEQIFDRMGFDIARKLNE